MENGPRMKMYLGNIPASYVIVYQRVYPQTNILEPKNLVLWVDVAPFSFWEYFQVHQPLVFGDVRDDKLPSEKGEYSKQFVRIY